ncbi:MAG: ABC transporter ATP-binding protein, partial [Xanthomonadales bacterium]|nr:ABC transporter ATP-binding protein [Xanthomonadales bacterium]
MTEPALSIRNLSVTFLGTNGPVPMVRGLSFDLVPGQLTGLVGESGCGKSVTAHALMNLLPSRSWSVAADRAMLADQSLAGLDERHWRDIRGASMAMIFQQPSRALDPVYPVGAQLARVVRRRDGASRQIAAGRALELLGESGFDDPAGVSAAYPHQLSGGMRQLVMIAMAMAAKPAVLIADEPTTALDVSIQAQIIALLRRLCKDHDTAVILITHDMGV